MILAEDLRKAILQAAIQGKLVEQRPEEGTGDELYEEITALKKAEGLPDYKHKEINTDDLFDIPDNWKWVLLGDIISDTEAGKSPQCSARIRKGAEWGVIKTTAIQDGKFIEKENKVLPDGFQIQESQVIHVDDLLITRAGPRNRTGITCIVEHEPEQLILSDKTVRIAYIKGYIDARYLQYVLKSPATKVFLFGAMTGMAASQVNISQEKMKMLPIPLPSIKEQQRISYKLKKILCEIEKYADSEREVVSIQLAFPDDMRKSILQYAMQGKLVEQRSEEGTGEELYQQIQVEKIKLIKEGQLKKEKVLAEITEDEIPFDIPDSWKWVRLGAIGDWGAGGTPSRTKTEYYSGDIPWLKTGDLNDGFIDELPEFITKKALDETSLRLNPVGSVLMAMYGATIGKLGILNIEATTNQACCACIPYNGIYNKYLFYYLFASRTEFIRQGAGGAQPNISRKKIVRYLFPLPPIEEQKRIAEKLDRILPHITDLKEAI